MNLTKDQIKTILACQGFEIVEVFELTADEAALLHTIGRKGCSCEDCKRLGLATKGSK